MTVRLDRTLFVLAALTVGASGCALPGAASIAPPKVPPGVQPGGSLRVAITAPSGVTPPQAYEPSGELISGLLCDTLVSVDPTTGEVVPGIAKSWQVSGRNITLQLRHGLHFPDGHTLHASDVAYSLDHLANPSLGSRMAGLLSNVVGAQQLSQNLFANSKTTLHGVSVLDQYSVQINVLAPDPGFLYTLAQPATAPVESSLRSSSKPGGPQNPMCVGPYRLAQPYVPGQKSVVLSRSPKYYAGNAAFTGGGAGYLDSIEFDIYPTAAAAQSAVVAGSADVAQAATDDAIANLPAGVNVVKGVTPTEEFVGVPDSLSAPLGGRALRVALSRAINRQALVQSVWGGAAIPAVGFLPPGVGVAALGSSCGDDVPVTGDPVGAKSLLNADQLSKLATGHFTFYVNNDNENVAEVQAIAAQWQAAFGMHVTVQPTAWTTYQQKASVGTGFDGIFRQSWTGGAAAPTPTSTDPVAFLGSLFASSDARAGNWEHFQDPKVDFRFSQDVQPAALGLKRRVQVAGLSRYLCKAMPMIPVAYGESRWLVRTSAWGSARKSFLALTGEPNLREFHRS